MLQSIKNADRIQANMYVHNRLLQIIIDLTHNVYRKPLIYSHVNLIWGTNDTKRTFMYCQCVFSVSLCIPYIAYQAPISQRDYELIIEIL